MNVTVELMNACHQVQVPEKAEFQQWSAITLETLAYEQDECELSIRLVDEVESALLNKQYRNKQGSTNILSFPADQTMMIDFPMLGDLAICADVVIREAEEQSKPVQAHWAHMTVHGVLHLMGYDHEEESMANIMEALEISVMAKLGYENPYLETPILLNT